MRSIITLAAVLSAFALAAPAASAAGTGKYCIKGPGSEVNCNYQTMASCDKAKKGTQTCVANPSSTTGSGSMSTGGSSSGAMKK
jgi:Protein of unknown function (DUF3551)